jgi:hypothetical protein
MEAGGPKPSRRWAVAIVVVGVLLVAAGAWAAIREVKPDRTIHPGAVVKKTAIIVHPGAETTPTIREPKVVVGLLDTNESRTVSFEGLSESLPDFAAGTDVDVETEGKDGPVTRVRYNDIWYGGTTDKDRFVPAGLAVLAGLVVIGIGVWRIQRARWA